MRACIPVIAVVGLTTAVLASAPLGAQERASTTDRPYSVVVVDQLDWRPDPEFPELDHAVVQGNVRAAEPYVYRLRANAPAELPLHTHGKSEYVTVLKGTLRHGPEGASRGDAGSCSAGCFIVIPAGRGHQAWLEPGTVLQVHGIGPVEADDHPVASGQD